MHKEFPDNLKELITIDKLEHTCRKQVAIDRKKTVCYTLFKLLS